MTEKHDREAKLIAAAMDLAAETPWQDVTYAEIVARSGLSLAEAYATAPTGFAILQALSRQADRSVLAEPAERDEGDARDRLFDVLMRRFDALQPYRGGLASVAYAYRRKPASAAGLSGNLLCSMRAMLLAAGLETDGLRGALRVKGLTAIWVATMRTFLQDDSEDLSRTMASLDSQLRRAERMLRYLPTRDRFAPRRRDEPAAEEGEAPRPSRGDSPDPATTPG